MTGTSFAWVGGPRSSDEPTASTPLRRRALDGYRRLEREVAGVQVRWHGSVHWGYGDLAGLTPGPGEACLDAAGVRALEPHVSRPPSEALHVTPDGAVDPCSVTHALVDAARGLGARLLVSTTVVRLVAAVHPPRRVARAPPDEEHRARRSARRGPMVAWWPRQPTST